jgi:excisionase family DNA binding protein
LSFGHEVNEEPIVCQGQCGKNRGNVEIFRRKFMARRLLSIPEGAEYLGLKPKGLWAMVERRDIESVKVGRLRKISLEALEAYIAEHTTPARRQVS